MTTETADTLNPLEKLPWDSFLEEHILRESRPGPERERLHKASMDQVRRSIEGFRAQEWSTIKRDLAMEHLWNIPEGLEPHWVSPGAAVYWQQDLLRTVVKQTDEDGHSYTDIEWVPGDWLPTTSGLPANNSSVIAGYLNNGFRLRPPGTMDVEVLKLLVPPDALQAITQVEPERAPYWCYRHKEGDRFPFKTWEVYMRHCVANSESPEYEIPGEIMDKAKEYPYFCHNHVIGFKTKRAATQHIRTEQGRMTKAIHVSLGDMTQIQGEDQPEGGLIQKWLKH